MSKKITLEEFKSQILSKFGGHVEIEDSSYNGMRGYIIARCNIHNIDISKKMASQLLNARYPCPDCYKQVKLNKHIVKFNNSIQEYYPNARFKPEIITQFKQSIEIWCNKHGWNKTDTEAVSFQRYGCRKCARKKVGKSRIGEQRVSYETFVRKVHDLFGKELTVVTTKQNFINQQHVVEVTCSNPEHKNYQKTGTQILNSSGCKYCRSSRGELLVAKTLEKIGLKYETEKRFQNCVDKKPLPFDFWLPDYAALIEFQGRQHFEAWKLSGGEKGLEKLKRRDQIKADWAKENKIPLLLIDKYSNTLESITEFIDGLEGNANKRIQTLMNNIELDRLEKWAKYKRRLDELHKGKLSFDNTYWTTGNRTIKYECIKGEHGERSADIYSLLKGHGCSLCAGNVIIDDRVELAKTFAMKKNGNCHSTNYVNTDAHMLWSCDKAHYWLASYDSVVKRDRWCPWCAKNHRAHIINTVNRLIKAGYRDYAQQSFDIYLDTFPQLKEHFGNIGLN